MNFDENRYQASDGLSLYYRKYGTNSNETPIICLSGITRNSNDFHEFASQFSEDRIVYALDYRGRGKSDYDPDYKNYNPQTYLADTLTFMAVTAISKAIFVGTSLGGLLTMGMAGLAPQYLAAAVINDVGPEISSEGSSRIAGYLGTDIRYNSLEEAASAQKVQYQGSYPDLDWQGWMASTETAFVWCKEDKNFKPNYDLKIGAALTEQIGEGETIDLWPFFEALKTCPTLAVHGVLSDVLSTEIFEKMQRVHPAMEVLSLENRGHVPLLNEPSFITKITQFLEKV
jgi:pimeloyl-ACP methyl ester carboxylesterase